MSTYQEPLAVAERIFIMVEEQACLHCGYDFIYDQEGCDECFRLTAFLEQHGFTVPEEGASLGDARTVSILDAVGHASTAMLGGVFTTDDLCGCWIDGEFRPGERPCEETEPVCPTCGYQRGFNGWFCKNGAFHNLDRS